MKSIVWKALSAIILLSACSGTRQVAEEDMEQIDLDTMVIYGGPQPLVYKGSEKRINDVLHTKLDLSFDWDSCWVFGNAVLDVTPYFHPVSKLVLDAREFTIKEVKVGSTDSMVTATYEYDGQELSIDLGRSYKRNEQYQVSVSYIARPNDRKAKPGNAIQSDKGLYFVKPDSADKSTWQIWSQGETEANSAWFPTIDSPNEKMNQEILLTVDTMYETLSNGIKIFEMDNQDGTRTDYWKFDLQHSPYLTMIAIGDFAVVKDQWRGREVNYYVDKEYEPYARDIFGNTPEMLEFFSNKLLVEYPWPKFSQIVVKEYVSGAMENTTAVIYGEFVQRNSRELLDKDYEEYIAHELFHHWFGDLVTCESWANLPLNESFATYGEYLWIDHKYGRDAADQHFYDDMQSYFVEAHYLRKMIRYDYREQDDMFDRYSYQKGSCILHMLRNYLGDEAFFASLKHYLETHKFNTVEIHQLRQAFEKISGEDLTWFFDQWFFRPGHPQLEIGWEYLDSLKQVKLTVKQVQDFKKVELYRMPVEIDIYNGNTKETHHEILNDITEVRYYKVDGNPDLVNFDAKKTLLCQKTEVRPLKEWAFMYRNAPLYIDRFEAMEELTGKSDSIAITVVVEALDDNYWKIRYKAIRGISSAAKSNLEGRVKDKLVQLLQNDDESLVRAAAIDALSSNFKDDNLAGLYVGAISDSSYEVMSSALEALIKLDEKRGMIMARSLENESSAKIVRTIARIYANKGGANENAFFINKKDQVSGFERFIFIHSYSDYLERQNDSVVSLGMELLERLGAGNDAWWIRIGAVNSILEFQLKYEKRKLDTESKIKSFSSSNPNVPIYEKLLDSTVRLLDQINLIIAKLKENEKNESIIKVLEG